MKELKQFRKDLKKVINYFDEAYYFIFTDARIKDYKNDCKEIKEDLKKLQKRISEILERIKD
jgi:peptidoglycan hydrolase CwlO-like protein